MEDIYINKSVVENKNLTDEGFITYIALRKILNKNRTRDFICYEYLSYQLTGTAKSTLIPKIKKGIDNLCDLCLVEKKEEISKSGIELDMKSLVLSTDPTNTEFSYFTVIAQNEVRKIMCSSVKYKEKLLRYFVSVIGSINHQDGSMDNLFYRKHVGNSSVSDIAEKANISKSAALDYNTLLESLGLLVIYRTDQLKVGENGQIETGFTNCYGRPENEDIIKGFYYDRVREIGNKGVKNLSQDANDKRSMKQYYNNIHKGASYDTDTIKKVYKFYQDEIHNIEVKKIKYLKLLSSNAVTDSSTEEFGTLLNFKIAKKEAEAIVSELGAILEVGVM